jgi:hypothetical protein
MCEQRIRRTLGSFVCAGAMLACGGSGCSKDKTPNDAPPPVVAGNPICNISADCPSGQHCDLGECRQECNAIDPCTGQRVCSPRARCLAAGAPDQDPAPQTRYVGSVSVSPLSTELAGNETTLELTLTSTTATPVRYRVEVNAPFLTIAAPRGEFTGSTVIKLAVDAAGYQGLDVPGDVRIFTTLGTTVASTKLHSVLTGKYQGSFRYDGGQVELGDARFALDLVENDGNVKARVDPTKSLLFPANAKVPVYGFGTFESGSSLELTIEQPIDAKVGGSRNHFGRALGRRILLHLRPSQTRAWEGTFEEYIYGLFVNPMTAKGKVHLEYLPQAVDPGFDANIVLPTVTMPPGPNGNQFAKVATVFGRDAPTTNGFEKDLVAWYGALLSTLQNSAATGTLAFSSLRSSCESALGGVSSTDAAAKCGDVPGLAADLLAVASVGRTRYNANWVGTFMQAMAAPAALVAQDHLVEALKTSLGTGSTAAELAHYDSAVQAISPVAAWFLQPGLLEYLRATPDADAALPANLTSLTNLELSAVKSGTLGDSYPAARALTRILRLLAEADGEKNRLLTITTPGPNDTRVIDTQTRALVTYLEAVAFLDVLSSWSKVSPALGATMAGLLDPIDTGFGALLEGADVLGVPAGYVPFVYRETDTTAGSTNFEQVMGQAAAAIQQAKAQEQAFAQDTRQFDVDQFQLRDQRNTLQATFDSRLAELCGATFDPSTIQRPEDWASCGASGGTVSQMAGALQGAQAAWNSAQGRMRAAANKIEIDKRTLAEKQKVHAETLHFIAQNGQALEAITYAEGMLEAASSAMQMAANASLLNAGAPAGMAAAEYMIKTLKANLEVGRQRLQTAQTMRFEQANAKIELIEGMANIQREVIDLGQLDIEFEQNVLEVAQKRVDAANALEEAKRVFAQRARALEIANQNPIGDPSFRIVRDAAAENALRTRGGAQFALMLMARALEYEINRPLPALPAAVLAARAATAMDSLENCMKSLFDGYYLAYSTPQEYATTVSVRQMLGVTGPRTDDVTGEELSPGQQFRMLVLRNENLTQESSVRIKFSTNLNPGNGLWSTDVCNDRVKSVQAQLVGDFLGDNQAEIHVTASGAAVQRACDADEVRVWSIQTKDAVVQAGVNTFGDAKPNTSFFGQAVARATWEIVINNGKVAAANQDVDFTKLDDVVLKITHQASPRQTSPIELTGLSCAAGFTAQ